MGHRAKGEQRDEARKQAGQAADTLEVADVRMWSWGVTVSPIRLPRLRRVIDPSAISSSRSGSRPSTIAGAREPFRSSKAMSGRKCPSTDPFR
jgi:hypothetical protein